MLTNIIVTGYIWLLSTYSVAGLSQDVLKV